MELDLFLPLEQPKKPLQNTRLSFCVMSLSSDSSSFASKAASFFTPNLEFSFFCNNSSAYEYCEHWQKDRIVNIPTQVAKDC